MLDANGQHGQPHRNTDLSLMGLKCFEASLTNRRSCRPVGRAEAVASSHVSI